VSPSRYMCQSEWGSAPSSLVAINHWGHTMKYANQDPHPLRGTPTPHTFATLTRTFLLACTRALVNALRCRRVCRSEYCTGRVQTWQSIAVCDDLCVICILCDVDARVMYMYIMLTMVCAREKQKGAVQSTASAV
jgi:hypothetical protein